MIAPRRLVPVVATLLLSGCATALRPFDHPALPDPAAAETIRARGPIPAAGAMLPDVRLVTGPRPGDGGSRRDTIRGAEDVDVWLRAARARPGFAQPFELRPRTIMVCDDLAIETGWYPSARRGDAAAVLYEVDSENRYVALWRETPGGWRLAGVWLEPERPLAEQRDPACAAVRSARRESRRLRFGAAVRLAGPADVDGIRERLEARGWPGTTTRPSLVVTGGAWADWRVTPAWSARLGYVALGATEAAAADPAEAAEESVLVGGHAAYLVAAWRAGPLELSAGPVAGFIGVDWRSRVEVVDGSGRTISVVEEESMGRVAPGAALGLAFRVPVPSALLPVASLGYTWFPRMTAKPAAWSEGGGFHAGGASLSLGLELTP